MMDGTARRDRIRVAFAFFRVILPLSSAEAGPKMCSARSTSVSLIGEFRRILGLSRTFLMASMCLHKHNDNGWWWIAEFLMFSVRRR